MSPRRFTPEDLWKLPRVGAPEPSPDGSRLIVPVTTCSLETDESTTRLWLVPADAKNAGSGRRGDPARALTTAEASTGQPAWSPDGQTLAFVRKGGEKHKDKPQLFLMPVDGGEPERLTDLPLGVKAPRWLPDGGRILFLAGVYRDALTLEAAAGRSKELSEAKVKARVSEDRFFRYWDTWLTDGRIDHIFLMDLESRSIQDLTPRLRAFLDLDDPAGTYALSPDGKEIAYCACRSRPPYDDLSFGIYTIPVPAARASRPAKPASRTVAARPRLISEEFPHAVHPVYSPDGAWIVYGISREIDFYGDRVRLTAYERRTRRSTVLTEGWDRSAGSWAFGRQAERIFLTAENEGRDCLFSLGLASALKNPGRARPRELARGGSLSRPRPAGGAIFFNRSTIRQPPEIVRYSIRGGSLEPVTAFTEPVLKDLQIPAVEEVYFPGHQDHPVQMYLVYPPGRKPPARGRKPGRRMPLVHLIHGGPHGMWGDMWHWRWNPAVFSAQGYLTALVNFHGSTSWGQEFTNSILGRQGGPPYDDIMGATDYLIERGLADPGRMAATGGSYGGYLVSWIASQTKRFACLVNHAGVADFQTQFASDVTHGRPRSIGGELWGNLEGLDQYNPMRHASGFRSPMLVLHGEQDFRVPFIQGLEIYSVYKAKKLPARLVIYPDENHWILKPLNSLHWYGEFLGWLEKWLKRRKR